MIPNNNNEDYWLNEQNSEVNNEKILENHLHRFEIWLHNPYLTYKALAVTSMSNPHLELII